MVRNEGRKSQDMLNRLVAGAWLQKTVHMTVAGSGPMVWEKILDIDWAYGRSSCAKDKWEDND